MHRWFRFKQGCMRIGIQVSHFSAAPSYDNAFWQKNSVAYKVNTFWKKKLYIVGNNSGEKLQYASGDKKQTLKPF